MHQTSNKGQSSQ